MEKQTDAGFSNPRRDCSNLAAAAEIEILHFYQIHLRVETAARYILQTKVPSSRDGLDR